MPVGRARDAPGRPPGRQRQRTIFWTLLLSVSPHRVPLFVDRHAPGIVEFGGTFGAAGPHTIAALVEVAVHQPASIARRWGAGRTIRDSMEGTDDIAITRGCGHLPARWNRTDPLVVGVSDVDVAPGVDRDS